MIAAILDWAGPQAPLSVAGSYSSTCLRSPVESIACFSLTMVNPVPPPTATFEPSGSRTVFW